jgi:hypothetical protein
MIGKGQIKKGTVLNGTFKGKGYTVNVIKGTDVEGKGGSFQRAGQTTEFSSLSAVGSSITGHACNGWLFFSKGKATSRTKAAVTEAAQAKHAGKNVLQIMAEGEAKATTRKARPANMAAAVAEAQG